MQNKYVGDIGDFGKYGLLRALTGHQTTSASEPHLTLGVVWYLYPNEAKTADGKFTDYLDETEKNHAVFRDCAPALYDTLRCLVKAGERNVARVQNSDVLPGDTAYYHPSLCYEQKSRRPDREVRRQAWIKEACEKTSDAQLVFVDPDNGLSETIDRFRKKGPKFVFMDDLIPYAKRRQSLVIYHHLSRQGTADHQIKSWSARLRDNIGIEPWSLRYRRGSARVFFVIPNEEHQAVLASRVRSFCDGPWKKHFCLVESA